MALSSFAEAIEQARGIEQCAGLIDQLLDIERDLNRLFRVAGFGAGIGRLGDAGRLLKLL